MPSKLGRITETEVGIAVLRILNDRQNGTATVAELRDDLPNYASLSADDQVPSDTRKNEEIWEQQVRNLKSHSKTEGNIFLEGLAEYPSKGFYRITEVGRRYLASKGF